MAAGLALGKQAGIFSSIWLCVRFRIAQMPRGGLVVRPVGSDGLRIGDLQVGITHGIATARRDQDRQ